MRPRAAPSGSSRYQWHEITPQFLDRTIRALKRWKFDLVSMDEVCRRAVTLPTRHRFASLTFDGGYKDVITSAYPVLSRHGVPFTIYLPTAFPDGLGEAWWLALEDMIARENRISLVIDRKERRFSIAQHVGQISSSTNFSRAGCARCRRRIFRSRSTISASAIRSTSRRCRASVSMDWDDLAKLAADPMVTIGSATVNYPVLSNLKDADAQREMAMGKAVAEAAFHRDVRHFAYPFGDRDVLAPRSMSSMAEEAGFASAVIGDPGRRRGQGLHQFARAAAYRLGRTAALAARDAGDAVRDVVSRGEGRNRDVRI